MPIKYNGLALFDLFTVKYLKIKAFKSFPGGIFTMIFFLINIGVLIGTICMWLFEPTKMVSQILPSKESNYEANRIQSKINISISSHQENMGDTLKYINTHYKLIEYYKNETLDKIYGRLYQGNIIQHNSTLFSLNYSIPAYDLISQNKDTDFPRLAIENCAYLTDKALPFFLAFENPELLDDCAAGEDPMDFYKSVNILNKIFVFNVYSDYYVLEEDFSIKTLFKTFEIFFSFRYEQFDSYITELNRLALIQQGDNTAEEYFNWLNPDYQVLTKIGANDHYSFHLLLTSNYHDIVILFVVYKNGFMYYLNFLGSLIQFCDLLKWIPNLWTPYYASLVIIGYYLRRSKENRNDLGLSSDDFWENLSYCQWLSIRIGCSSQKKKLNEKLIQMRANAIKQYEKLYSTPNSLNSRESKEIQLRTLETELRYKEEV